MKTILAFETSCDDTAVAIVAENSEILGEAVYSQLECHAPYGGVVPEIGSRAHIEQIDLVTKDVFAKATMKPHEIDAVAATFAPGLLGPLLVGAQYAKGFALSVQKPLIAVHHIEGHILSGAGEPQFCAPPFVALVVSGGHTALYACDERFAMTCLGETLDDAAGEAFDKIGRALGLPYPAGKIIDELAQNGSPARFNFPRPMRSHDSLDFSFSGLKTAALEIARKHAPLSEMDMADFCASLCDVIADSLCERAMKAVSSRGVHALVAGGGVIANSFVRAKLASACTLKGIQLYVPKPALCTDNAVMIARAALVKMRLGKLSSTAISVSAHLPIERSHELVFQAI